MSEKHTSCEDAHAYERKYCFAIMRGAAKVYFIHSLLQCTTLRGAHCGGMELCRRLGIRVGRAVCRICVHKKLTNSFLYFASIYYIFKINLTK